MEEEESSASTLSLYDQHSAPFQNLNQAQGTPSCSPIVYSYAGGYHYFGPSINPTNNLQFCCRRTRNPVNAQQQGDLIVYDFSSDKTKIIATEVLGEPHWSIKNWIIFARMENAHSVIYKIKPNGDSLTLLLSNNSPAEPHWSPDGTSFVFFCNVCQVSKVADEKGVVLKSFTFKMLSPGWKSATELMYLNTNGFVPQFVSYDLKKDSLTNYALITNGEQCSWSYNTTSQELFCCAASLFRSTMPLSSSNKLKGFTSVETQSFQDVNSFPNLASDKIISARMTSAKLINENCGFLLRSDISIMNADGTNERKVLIPE